MILWCDSQSKGQFRPLQILLPSENQPGHSFPSSWVFSMTVLSIEPTGQRLLGESSYSDFWDENSLFQLGGFNKIQLSEEWIVSPKNPAFETRWSYLVFNHHLITDVICVFLRWIQLQLLECLICELLCFYFQGQNDAAEIRTGNFRFHW